MKIPPFRTALTISIGIGFSVIAFSVIGLSAAGQPASSNGERSAVSGEMGARLGEQGAGQGEQRGGSGEQRATLLTGKRHSLIAYAGNDHSFTLEVGVHTAKPSDIPGFITIDKQIVQSTMVPVAKSLDLAGLTPAREKEILLKYMKYELDYYKKKLKQDYRHLQTEWVSLHGRLFLLWYFDMPENYKLVSRQVYASTLFYDQVMDLNAPVFKADDWGNARGLLVKLAGSMKTYDHRLDLEAVRKKL